MLLEDHIPDGFGELKELVLHLAEQGKRIRAGFLSRQGTADTENIYGERQVEMDKWADEILVESLSELPFIATVSSEERDDVILVNDQGRYSVTFDPLDGSSLMGVNLTVGTIIGIFEGRTPLLPGKEMVGAMYILYGPLTTLVYCLGKGVHEFALNEDGEFVLQSEDMRIGEDKIYSPGALRTKWLPAHARYIEKLEGLEYKLRFCGCFVADVHQILHKGGMFTYPAYQGKASGKLRLLFEANPMGYIVTKAGGAISNGTGDILEMQPSSVDQRVPIYIGGRKEIEMLHEEMKKEVKP